MLDIYSRVSIIAGEAIEDRSKRDEFLRKISLVLRDYTLTPATTDLVIEGVKMTPEYLINILNQQRSVKKMSVRALAEKAHCNNHTLTHWFSGQRKLVQIAILFDIANALNLEIELKEKR